MTSIIRANTDQLRSVARQMRGAADQILADTGASAREMEALAETWSGSARDRGMARWAEIHPRYQPAAEQLNHFASELDGLAARLEEAARVFGDGGVMGVRGAAFLTGFFLDPGFRPSFPPIGDPGFDIPPHRLPPGFAPPFHGEHRGQIPGDFMLPDPAFPSNKQPPGFDPISPGEIKPGFTTLPQPFTSPDSQIHTWPRPILPILDGSKGDYKLLEYDPHTGLDHPNDLGIRYAVVTGAIATTATVVGVTAIGAAMATGSAKAEAGAYEAGVGISQGKDGPSIGAYGEFYTGQAKAEGVIGDRNLGVTGDATVRGPGVEGFIGLRDGEVGAKIGGSLVSVEGEVGANIAGVNVGLKGEVGLKAELGFELGKKDIKVCLPFVSFGISFGGAKDGHV